MSLKKKLERYRALQKKKASEEKNINQDDNIQKEAAVEDQDRLFAETSWQALGFTAHKTSEGYCYIKETTYPAHTRFGNIALNDIYKTISSWNRSSLKSPLSAQGKSVEDLLFFDTETTGLSHGAGHTIFLFGTGCFKEEKLTIKQYALARPGQEAALFLPFLQDHSSLSDLVTYNGKSFDWPHVKSKHVLIRERVPTLPEYGHYDLLHAARRVWKHRMEKVSLGNVEAAELQMSRVGDTPGFLAPMLYKNYVESEDATCLKGIIQHNEQDIVSLVLLYVRLSSLILDYKTKDEGERLALAKWLDKDKNDEEAAYLYASLLSSNEWREEAAFQLAGLCKRENAYERALALYKSIQGEELKKDAWLAAAMLYEHQFQQYDEALSLVNQLVNEYADELPGTASLQHRHRRLLRKIAGK
ncbi:ribonuclease H-like domain-containing protein [Aureibacillus halotolerans]|uniref:YprB ribonuclease H-like domain-containing protein n=1 Tax=Aureibacillus halotolerans TaxID=1508390 RepID=A0A4R6U9H2_9BACI|nr:ribonuclease H-like domain-containing protein [Aureibacillus halotolerans]TDQ41479.1 hypothetical protein EV213_10357 [Aureibacillus halotolerans]